MKTILSILLVVLVGCASSEEHARSRAASPEAQTLEPPSFVDVLPSVETVSNRQAELGLTSAQRAAIENEIRSARPNLEALRSEIRSKESFLRGAIAQANESSILQVATELTELEGAAKLAHLRLRLRVQAQLTPEQRTKLIEANRRGPE